MSRKSLVAGVTLAVLCLTVVPAAVLIGEDGQDLVVNRSAHQNDWSVHPRAAERNDAGSIVTVTIPVASVSSAALARALDRYSGMGVAVHSNIGEVVSPHAFTLGPDASNPDVIVLVPFAVRGLRDGDSVVVVGTVLPYSGNNLERDFAWFDRGWLRDSEVTGTLTNRPVVIAQSIRSESGGEMVQTLRAPEATIR